MSSLTEADQIADLAHCFAGDRAGLFGAGCKDRLDLFGLSEQVRALGAEFAEVSG